MTARNHWSGEKRIRRSWLFLTLFYLFVLPCALSGLALLSVTDTDLFSADLGRSIMSAASSAICLWLLLHCAYRKRGTKLLTLSLFANSFLTPVGLLVVAVGFSKSSVAPWTALFSVVAFITTVWWLHLTLRLRELNLAYRRRHFLSSEEYAQSVAEIRAAKTLNELELKVRSVLHRKPHFLLETFHHHWEEMHHRLSSESLQPESATQLQHG